MATLSREQVQRLPRAAPVRKPTTAAYPRVTATVVDAPQPGTAARRASDDEITLSLLDALDASRGRREHAEDEGDHPTVRWLRGRLVDEYV
ncbi:MAG TPA: hypothetical protein VNJ51_13045 [Candidatus Dormibacteraeota bacterium]|nr:hypothetical protein [Candidatus Dormibacteraeota bacterium]